MRPYIYKPDVPVASICVSGCSVIFFYEKYNHWVSTPIHRYTYRYKYVSLSLYAPYIYIYKPDIPIASICVSGYSVLFRRDLRPLGLDPGRDAYRYIFLSMYVPLYICIYIYIYILTSVTTVGPLCVPGGAVLFRRDLRPLGLDPDT